MLFDEAWCEATAHRVLGDAARFHEVHQVVVPSGLRAHSRHPETAEWLSADERTGDPAVQVEIADSVVAPGSVQVTRLAAEDAAGQFVSGRVGEFEGRIENP